MMRRVGRVPLKTNEHEDQRNKVSQLELREHEKSLHERRVDQIRRCR
jgi:hypothetical protein